MNSIDAIINNPLLVTRIPREDLERIVLDICAMYRNANNSLLTVLNKHISENAETILPPELSTPRAMAIWKVLIEEGLVDVHFQLAPSITNPEAAIIAAKMGTLLKLKTYWKPFEKLWQIKHLKTYNQRAFTEQKVVILIERLNVILADFKRKTY